MTSKVEEVVLDEVCGDVMLVEVFGAVGSVPGFHVIVAAEPLQHRLSHVHSSESIKTFHSLSL